MSHLLSKRNDIPAELVPLIERFSIEGKDPCFTLPHFFMIFVQYWVYQYLIVFLSRKTSLPCSLLNILCTVCKKMSSFLSRHLCYDLFCTKSRVVCSKPNVLVHTQLSFESNLILHKTSLLFISILTYYKVFSKHRIAWCFLYRQVQLNICKRSSL